MPDFLGGLVVQNNDGSLTRLDGMTGSPLPIACDSCEALAVHTDGTIFTAGLAPAFSVIGIDPTTGAQKFAVPLPAAIWYDIMIAGDGYAYVPYVSYDGDCDLSGDPNCVGHFRILQVNSQGAYNTINIYDRNSDEFPAWMGSGGGAGVMPESVNMITNADTGILFTWTNQDANGDWYSSMAVTTGTAVSFANAPGVPDMDLGTGVIPVLQAQDGSFVGETLTSANGGTTDMVAFDATGNVLWVVPNDQPQIATDDGGVIGQSGITYDQNGNATGEVVPFVQSWTMNAYEYSSATQFAANPIYFAVGFAPFVQANSTGNGTAQVPADSVTNAKVKGILTPALWKSFSGSNCAAVFANPSGIAGGVAYYSLAAVQKKQGMTNYYDVGNPGVGALTMAQVTAKQVPTNQNLVSYLGVSNAVTSPNFGFVRQSAIIFAQGQIGKPSEEFQLVHELLLHAYAAWSDAAVYGNAVNIQNGLQYPSNYTPTTAPTTYITSWIGTDCKCTPGVSNSCSANTAKW